MPGSRISPKPLATFVLALCLAAPSLPPAWATKDAATTITADQAVALAVNRLTVGDETIILRHPSYEVRWSELGVRFEPKGGGPVWSWRLAGILAGDKPLAQAVTGGAPQRQGQPGVVIYDRGVIVEEYLLRRTTVEQRFVLREPLELGDEDFLLVGAVTCDGVLETTSQGWRWRNEKGAVSLGQVRVYDARGHELPARMTAAEDETRIVVDGASLVDAAYPVTIDPEIGANDFRISDMGGTGDPDFAADGCAVAFNSINNEYLVVWRGDDNTGALLDEEFEIFGQRIDAATGAEIGTDFRISDMGGLGDPDFDADFPAVAFNSTNNEYLVVWRGDDNTDDLLDGEFEIFGQRIDATTGAEVGVNDFRISDMGGTGYSNYAAFYLPAVAFNEEETQYLVVWWGDDNTGGLVDDEFEIFGQRIDAATGKEIGANDFRISDMGGTGNPDFDATNPAVAYNSMDNEYLVVWSGDDDSGGLVDEENEIFGQRIDGASGIEEGTNDFRISDVGGTGDDAFVAWAPHVTYNGTDNEYLVVWFGDDNTGGLVSLEYEIFGQRVEADTGLEVGANDFRISDMGGTGDDMFAAWVASVTYNSADHEYLVVWRGNDNTGGLVDREREIFGQRIDAATGLEVGANDFRISDMGGTGDDMFHAAIYSDVAYNSTENEYLVVWSGDDNRDSLVDGESEIFGQRIAPSVTTLFATDVEPGSPGSSIDNDFCDGAGLWQLTTDCFASDLGHTAPSALFYGQTSTCDYDAGTSEGVATIGPISLAGVSPPVELRFAYLLETELAADLDFDVASVEISTDGGRFETVASNAPSPGEVVLFDPSGSWETAAVDLSGRAGSTILARFHFSTGDGDFNAFPGFYVDDVTVITTSTVDPLPIFVDGFESGDTSAWSSAVQ